MGASLRRRWFDLEGRHPKRLLILPDSSAWIEELRRTGSPVDRTLERLLDSRAEIAVTEPVVMELLAGARTRREVATTRRRRCREGGEPVRNTLDCLIAAVAIREGASVLHADRDFETIARHTELRIEAVGTA